MAHRHRGPWLILGLVGLVGGGLRATEAGGGGGGGGGGGAAAAGAQGNEAPTGYELREALPLVWAVSDSGGSGAITSTGGARVGTAIRIPAPRDGGAVITGTVVLRRQSGGPASLGVVVVPTMDGEALEGWEARASLAAGQETTLTFSTPTPMTEGSRVVGLEGRLTASGGTFEVLASSLVVVFAPNQASASTLWYRDQDGDDFGDSTDRVLAPERPDGFAAAGGDCDDADPYVHPGVTEVANDLDDDCDGQVDEGTPGLRTFYADDDGDGYGGSDTLRALTAPAGYVAGSGDCDDADASVNPGATEVPNNGKDDDCNPNTPDQLSYYQYYRDADADTWGTGSAILSTERMPPPGHVVRTGDCDDADASVHPGAAETANGVDDDCDGQVDEGIATTTWYRDMDGDGYGTPLNPVVAATQPTGYVSNGTDCDDTRNTVYPGRPELINGIDDDCDGQVDEGIPGTTWYQDADGDGCGSATVTTVAGTQPAGYVGTPGDCDDTDGAVRPGATETLNGRDDDCDGQIDEGLGGSTWYRDADNDGYGSVAATMVSATQPAGYVATSGDCDDTNGSVRPGATETYNGRDDDCDGQVDEGFRAWYLDQDRDGWGTLTQRQYATSPPSGFVSIPGDCSDTNPNVHPAAQEIVGNGMDENCDGQDGSTVRSWYRDVDGDGWGVPASQTQSTTRPGAGWVALPGDCNDANPFVNPGMQEILGNGLDDDCDGSTQ